MQIFVNVKTGARQESIERINDSNFRITVKEQPQENEANYAVVEALVKYFNVTMSQIKLVRGRTSKHKVFEIV